MLKQCQCCVGTNTVAMWQAVMKRQQCGDSNDAAAMMWLQFSGGNVAIIIRQCSNSDAVATMLKLCGGSNATVTMW